MCYSFVIVIDMSTYVVPALFRNFSYIEASDGLYVRDLYIGHPRTTDNVNPSMILMNFTEAPKRSVRTGAYCTSLRIAAQKTLARVKIRFQCEWLLTTTAAGFSFCSLHRSHNHTSFRPGSFFMP